MNYSKDIEIDETALDVEWLEQPLLMAKYCRHMAEARLGMDLAKEALEVERATLDKEIRSDPEAFEISKLTEATVQNAIVTGQSYQSKMKKYITAKYEYEIAQAAVRSVEHRKSALENLVRLHAASYFAGPSVPRNLTEERDRQANRKVTIRRSK